MKERTTFLNISDPFSPCEVEIKILLTFSNKDLIFVFTRLTEPSDSDLRLMACDCDHLRYLLENKTNYYELSKEQFERLTTLMVKDFDDSNKTKIKSTDIEIVERFINQYREEELPNRNQPYHYDAEADAGFKYFLIWLKNKIN